MKKIKKKFLSSATVKIVLAMLLAAVLTTSVFAATGAFNKTTEQVVTQDELQDHIKDQVIKQLEAKINELLNSGDTDISQKVANSLNQEEILNRLRQQIEDQISQYSGDLTVEQLDKLINDTIDQVLESLINETVKVAIDEAINNANIDGSFSVSEALKASVETEVKKQINKILDDNVDSIVKEVIDKVIKIEDKEPEKPIEPEVPVDPVDPKPEETEDKIVLSADKVEVVPGSKYIGKSLETFMLDNKDKLKLVGHDSEYGFYMDNIGDMIKAPYIGKVEGNVIYRYDYYISSLINDEYAQTGLRDTIIEKDAKYSFVVDSYNTNKKIAELISYEAGSIPRQINLWGKTQSNEFPAFELKTYTTLDGSDTSKVEDMLDLLGMKIEISSTGYKRITYKGLTFSESSKVGGLVPFCPSVYIMTGENTMTYAKGVHPSKSSHAVATKDTETTYYFAQEWDGKTDKSAVTFQ